MNTVYLVIPHTFASPISHSWTPNVGLILKEEHARSKHAAEIIQERHREHESNRKGRGSVRGKLPHLGFPKGRHQFPVNNTSVWQHLEAEHPGSSLAPPSPPTPPLLLIFLTFPFLLLPSSSYSYHSPSYISTSTSGSTSTSTTSPTSSFCRSNLRRLSLAASQLGDNFLHSPGLIRV